MSSICLTCNYQGNRYWICSRCAQNCHRGHTRLPSIKRAGQQCFCCYMLHRVAARNQTAGFGLDEPAQGGLPQHMLELVGRDRMATSSQRTDKSGFDAAIADRVFGLLDLNTQPKIEEKIPEASGGYFGIPAVQTTAASGNFDGLNGWTRSNNTRDRQSRMQDDILCARQMSGMEEAASTFIPASTDMLGGSQQFAFDRVQEITRADAAGSRVAIAAGGAEFEQRSRLMEDYRMFRSDDQKMERETRTDTFNKFSISLLGGLLGTKRNKSVVTAPFSLASLLCLIYQCAAGKTELELARLLNAGGSKAALYQQIGQISAQLNAGKIIQSYQAILCANQTKFRKTFSAMARTLNIELLPLANYRVANMQVSQITGNKTAITNIRPDTNLTLVSAVHLKPQWLHAFNARLTSIRTFEGIDSRRVAMMRMDNTTEMYYSDRQVQHLELSFADREYVMGFILPVDFDTFNIVYYDIDAFIASLIPTELGQVHIPKFTQHSQSKPIEWMQGGIKQLLTAAELPFMAEKAELHLSDVIQDVSVSIDEIGVEISSTYSDIGAGNSFVADHPFYYYVAYRPESEAYGRNQAASAGTILFMGYYA
jgi:serine protease inhibitor